MDKNNLTKSKESKKRFLSTLIIFSLIGQVAWVVENMYFNVFIYNMFGASESEISLMVMASSVAATLTTLFIGALSDKLGKRKVFMCGGYILWGISILLFALVREDIIGAMFPTAVSVSAVCITITIILDCIMTFFGSSANDACFNAWLTDSTSDGNRGMAEGINAMMPLVAILVVFGGFMGVDQTSAGGWTLIFSVIGGVVLVIGVLGIFIIKEPHIKNDENKHYFKNIIYGFKPSVVRENPKLYISLLLFTIFGISIQIFMPYLIIYYERSLEMTDYVFVMAPAIVLASVFTAIWGRMYDKLGFNKSIIPSLSLLILGYVLLFLTRGYVPVFIGSLLMMCGYLSGSAIFGASLREHTPVNKSGMFQGLRIVGQVLIPGVIGPMLGAMILKNAETDIINGQETFIPNANIFLGALAVAVVLLVILCTIILVSKGKNKNEEN